MSLHHLTDSQLLAATQSMIARERELVAEILKHLQEIERRRLFSDLGFSSLYAYAVKVLGYSEDQAYRRISAMRLLRSMPQLEEKIQSGQLTVSNLSLAQTLIRRESKTAPLPAEKRQELVRRLENKTSREAQSISLEFTSSPTPLISESSRPLPDELTELKLALPKTLIEKLNRLKGLRAHHTPNMSTAELLDQLCDLALEHWDPARKSKKQNRKPEQKANSAVVVTHSETQNAPKQKSIPRSTVTDIWRRDQGACQICGSRFALQVDHVHPRSFGGSNNIPNLRLLCRSCNQRAAVKKIGLSKMSKYI